MSKKSYQERYDAWLKNRYAPPPQPDLTPSQPSMFEMVPMRDGIRLYTEVFLPDNSSRFPVILRRSPYPFNRPSWNDKQFISYYLEAGYAFVFQMTRGQCRSEGTFHYYKDDKDDGYDCIEWLAAQGWCDGNVGMTGGSYSGGVQLCAAKAKPKALKCIMPTAFTGNQCIGHPFSGGVPSRSAFLVWHKIADAESIANPDVPYGDMILKHPEWRSALRKRPLIEAADGILSGDKLASWKSMISRPVQDDYWQSLYCTDEDLAELDIPFFFTDGWFDRTIGPIDYFERIERLQSGGEDRYLLVGPWDHAQTGSSFAHDKDHGERVMPKNGAVDFMSLRLTFFDRYLKGKTNNVIQPDRVRVYITGIDEWFDFSTFPVSGTKLRQMYLHSGGDARSFPGDGALSWDLPSDEPEDTYVYNPSLPTPSEAEPIHIQDRREIEIRSDVLTYTSAKFEAPLTILGDIKLVLHAASDGLDTDWFAIVTEVFPDERSIVFHYALPALRARYHQGFDKEVLLVPDEPTVFRFSLGPAGHQIMPGNRLRLSIFSAAFPLCDPNTNTGNSAVTDTEMRIARQTVFHDMIKPSHIVIPVISLNR